MISISQAPTKGTSGVISTGVIFANFSKNGNVVYAIKSFRLAKMKEINKSELFLISLVGISESYVAFFI